MKHSTDRILTTHAGSLIRPPAINAVMRALDREEPYDQAAFEETLRTAVGDVVRQQAEVGIDVPSDGEFGKRGWIPYVAERLTGVEYHKTEAPQATAVFRSRIYTDQERFAGFYSIYRQHERTLWLPREADQPEEDRPTPRR